MDRLIVPPSWRVQRRPSSHGFRRTGPQRTDADAAKIEIIHQDICSFQANWFNFYADATRVQITPLDPVSIRTFDLTLRTFCEFLPHTPVSGIGINYMCHFRVRSHAVLNSIGDVLAPKAPWGAFGARLMEAAPKTVLATAGLRDARAGGMSSITMLENYREDGRLGHRQIKIEPSVKVLPGLYVECNDHYAANPNPSPSAAVFLGGIGDIFDASISLSKSAAVHFHALSEGLTS